MHFEQFLKLRKQLGKNIVFEAEKRDETYGI